MAEKIVFDGEDGGNYKLPRIAELVLIAENVADEEDESDEVSGSSGFSGGGERMKRERAAKVSAEAIAIAPVPKETNEAVPDVRPTSAPPQMKCNTSLAVLTDSVALLLLTINSAIDKYALIAIVSHIWFAPNCSTFRLLSTLILSCLQKI